MALIPDMFSSVAQLQMTLRDPIGCGMPGFAVLHQLLELAQTHVHRAGDAIQPSSCVVPFFSCLQSIPASGSLLSQYFASGGQSIGASASVLPMNIQSWFSFRIDWFDLLAVQGTLKNLLQHHSSKHQFSGTQLLFMVQISHPYMTTGKTNSFD